ncbi:MAG: hypothetical protein ABI670_12570 [Chloroflexota bacterium]
MSKRLFANVGLLLCGIVLGGVLQPFRILPTEAQGGCRAFPETGKSACGRFLDYWTTHGGLAQQGYPISNEFQEVSELNGQTYTVQYFERSVFEKHPENAAPNDVLLSQLGTFQFKRKYPGGDPSGGSVPAPPAATPPQQGGIVGQVITVPDIGRKTNFRLEVVDAKETTKIPATGFWKEATATGKFVAVKFRATNIGTEPGTPTGYYIRLKDSKGRTFDTTSDINASLVGAEYYGGKPLGTTVQPGLTETLVFVYDVAPDAAGYLLISR